jgi:hypothetical protein
MHETTRARGTGRMKLTLKLAAVPALVLFALFVCGGFGYKDNKINKKTNKTLNSKTFK